MSTPHEPPIMVTREMIEAHYKSVMNAARLLLSQGETARAQDLLSDACRLPYPIPAPAAMPDAVGREDLDLWSTEEMELLSDYFDNSPQAAPAPASMPLTTERVLQAMEESGWPVSKHSVFTEKLYKFARALEHAHGIDGTVREGTQ